jgi:DNA polymerase/3'-5' exonuclease PolX
MNKELIDQFIALQNYYREQQDKGRTIAYGKAISALRLIDTKITNIGQIKGIRGIGPKVIEKVKEYLDTGKISAAETAKKELQKEKKISEQEKVLIELERVWGIGPIKAKKLYDQGIRSIKDLRKRTELLTEQQKIGLKHNEDLQQKVPRDMITSLYVIMRAYLDKKYGRGSYDMEIAGSYRRGAKESGDIDCLLSSKVFGLKEAVELFKKKNIVTDVLSMRKEKFMGVVHCPSGGLHVRLDIEFVSEEEWGTALLYFTGSKGFNVYMRADAKRKGMLLNEHGLYDINTGDKILQYPSEEDIFEEIGMKYVSPPMR